MGGWEGEGDYVSRKYTCNENFDRCCFYIIVVCVAIQFGWDDYTNGEEEKRWTVATHGHSTSLSRVCSTAQA
jgi:hypothetical protein